MARRPQVTTGKISDLVRVSTDDVDWSHLRDDLRALQPGDVLTVKCPHGVKLSRLRSTILTYGRRIFADKEWTVSTRTVGDRVHCFLAKLDSSSQDEAQST